MKCQVCRQEVESLNHQCKSHLLITKSVKDGHIHVHGDVDHKENASELIHMAAEEIGIAIKKEESDNIPNEIVFHNRQRIGDMLVFTCAIRDFKALYPNKRINVQATAMHIFDHNPNIDPTLKATEENTVKIGPKRGTDQSNRIDWHFTNAFRISIEDYFKIHIPQGESRPDIYFTQEEYDAPRVFDFPYWIISTSGEKGWGCKMYPHTKWQEFVDQNPDIKFVQIGTAEDDAPRLQGPNVIDYIGKTQSRETGIRDLFKLFLNAEGSIGLVSFHMHLSGALWKPAIVIAGGREPVHFTRYEGHAYLSTDGMLPCSVKACWHCNIDACTNPVKRPNHNGVDEIVPKCVDIITPAEISSALNKYYTGGRLKYNEPSPKPLPRSKRGGVINVVPTPPPKPKPIEITLEPVMVDENNCGLPWNGGSLTERDWSFIKGVINKYQIKRCLEFGAGLSTVLLSRYLRNPGIQGWVTTYETQQGWIDKVKKLLIKPDIRLWDGKEVIGLCFDGIPEVYDMAFVDGPAGGQNREIPTSIAAALCNVVIIHDAGREWEKKWQEKYLVGKFDGPIKGGHRCHLWVKKGFVARETGPMLDYHANEPSKGILTQTNGISEEVYYGQEAKEEKACVLRSRKHIQIVSTARGWGGCARSVTTIMRKLIKLGHYVDFIPFGNTVASREWKNILQGDLKQVAVKLDYFAVRAEADVLLMYADDRIWDFHLPEYQENFSRIGANRKIMMLNYRRGKVGQAEWTKGWDKYMFLCSWQEKDLLKVLPGVKTKVLPPCTDLEPFSKVNPDYGNGIRIVRHSSQGDTKFSPDFNVEVQNVLDSRSDVNLHFLPGPSFLAPGPKVFKYPRTDRPEVIANFLALGNLFWYSVPQGYQDMGPRVIVEAMAAGLPVIADSWIGGPSDRIVNGQTGFLFEEKIQHINAIATLRGDQLKALGEASRARARDHFSPDAWVSELLEEKLVTV